MSMRYRRVVFAYDDKDEGWFQFKLEELCEEEGSRIQGAYIAARQPTLTVATSSLWMEPSKEERAEMYAAVDAYVQEHFGGGAEILVKKCLHCRRPIHLDERGAAIPAEWADDTQDPFYCPRAINFRHKPTIVTRSS
jgi:hypothetical protein